ncbi:MAG: ATP synthase F1 subunit delta [Bacteroidota bacterium]
MKHSKVSIRYAKALFDLCLEQKILEQGLQDMMLVSEVYNENRELRLLLDSSIVNPEKKVSILQEIFKQNVSATVLGFLTILARKRRENNLEEISFEFIHFYKEHFKIKDIVVRSAQALDEATRQRIAALILNKTGYTAEFIEEVDPSLIGGFVLKMDDMTLDSSISRELKRLELEFRENVYIGKITSH